MLAKVRADGLPEADDNDTLADFDHDVISTLQRDRQGIVALIETFAGKRTYLAYGIGAGRAAAALNVLRERYPQHEMVAFDDSDAEWTALAKYRSRWPW